MDGVHQEHDKGYKDLLSHKKTFVEMIRNFVSERWVEDIDENDIVLIDKSFITKDFEGKEADIIYKLKLKEKEIIFYCLLELQSKVDFLMPLRLLEYMKCIWDEGIKNLDNVELKRKTFKLPVIVPIVLYNGKNNWTAKMHFKEMLNGHEIFDKYVLDFSYILFDVNRYKKEDLVKAANLIATVFLLDQKISSSEIVKRLVESVSVLKNLTSDQYIVFKRWLKFIIMQRMPDKSKEFVEDIIERSDFKEVDKMVSNLALAIEEMQKESKQEGRQEGIIEVAKEALINGADIEFVVKISKLDIDKVNEICEELKEKGQMKNK